MLESSKVYGFNFLRRGGGMDVSGFKVSSMDVSGSGLELGIRAPGVVVVVVVVVEGALPAVVVGGGSTSSSSSSSDSDSDSSED